MDDLNESEEYYEVQKWREQFLEGLSIGDAELTAQALRKLECIDGIELEKLAELFEGELISRQFPWRLEFKARSAGKPINYLLKRAKEFSVALAVRDARADSGNYDSAIAHVKENIEKHNLHKGDGWSLTRIKNAYRAAIKSKDLDQSK